MSQIADVTFSKLSIPPLERELMVLPALHLERGKYEWAQHEQIALDMGSRKDRSDKGSSLRRQSFDDRERALRAFTRQVVQSVRVDDAIFDRGGAVLRSSTDYRDDLHHRHLYGDASDYGGAELKSMMCGVLKS